MSDNHNLDDLFSDDEEYQPIVPKDKYKVQFRIDEPLMKTQPWRNGRCPEWNPPSEQTMEVMGCALYQMGVCDAEDKLRKTLFENPKCWIKTCYHSTKAYAFSLCKIGETFRFKVGDIHDNAQIAELVVMRAATESRHCMYKIISNAIAEGRSLGPEELQVVLNAVRLDKMPKGWQELGASGSRAGPGEKSAGEKSTGEKSTGGRHDT